MIRHIVLFGARNKAQIDRIIEGLSPLAKIPYARRLEVSRNKKIDQLGNDIDVVVYGEFDNEAEFAVKSQQSIEIARFLVSVMVAGTRNTRFLRLVEQAIPRLAA